MHRVVKGSHVRKPEAVNEMDIAKDVAKLAEKVKGIIPDITELLGQVSIYGGEGMY